MQYSSLLMGIIIMFSISVSVQSMISDTKKPKRIIEIVSAPIKCDRRSNVALQFQKDQTELIEAFFAKSDLFTQLKSRL